MPSSAANVATVKVGDAVTSIYGDGIVEEVRSDGAIVFVLKNWELAYGSKVKCFLNAAAVTKVAAVKEEDVGVEVVHSNFKVGDGVKSIYGNGIVEEVRNDGAIIFTLKNWELAYGSKVRCFLNASAVTADDSSSSVTSSATPPAPSSAQSSTSKFTSGSAVSTPYGEGVITSVRESDYVVQLTKDTWELAYGQRPTLYLADNNLKPSKGDISGGERVKSVYGVGYVLSKRSDGSMIVESAPEKWSLAYNQLPRMFLDASIVSRVTA